jgi:hypothetical protein
MRSPSILLVAVAVAACGGGGATPPANPDAPTAQPDAAPAPPDAASPLSISDWKTKDPTPLLSMAGVWSPLGVPNASLVKFWGVARLGAAQRQGVVLGGWSFGAGGFGTTATWNPVTVAMLTQQADGTLSVDTGLTSSLVTNGLGSVNVADFNGDGKDDIFLAAHNEAPFVNKASTAYLSKPDGTLTKVTLGDSVQDHDATLATVGGKQVVLAMSFGDTPANPLMYSYDGQGGFAVGSLAPDPNDAPAGQSIAAADFLGDGRTEVIVGEMSWGMGIAWTPTNASQQYLFGLDHGLLALPAMPMPAPYFNKPAYDAYVSEFPGKTHNPRVWIDDLNHDGRPDVLVNAMIWSAKVGVQRNTIQLLMNQGGLSFADATDTLDPDFDLGSSVDYSMRMVDVDGSGINSLFLSHQDDCDAGAAVCAPQHGNYILVNDGSGRLHVAMHDEFLGLKGAVARFVAAQHLPGVEFDSGNGFYAWTPLFIAYENAAGHINFVAVVQVAMQSFTVEGYALVNLPLDIDLATQYRENLTVADRNGSKRIRTFAGDDTIYANNAGVPGTVDGGVGTDTAVYPGKKADYTVTKTTTGWTVVGPSVDDTLKNVEILQFADGTMP